MQSSTFLIQRLRDKFLAQDLSDFNVVIPQNHLNLENKTRSNIFSWRGQFSPQLIENLLLYYCPKKANILDPFAGSGTTLYEAACFGLPVSGCEVNPAAWILSRTYQLMNLELSNRERLVSSITEKLEKSFPKPNLFDNSQPREFSVTEFKYLIPDLYKGSNNWEIIILDTFIILLDLANNQITTGYIHHIFYKLCQFIKNFPYSQAPITSLLCDARCLPIDTDSIDFVITSPPYINVFNYHQNYRVSAEALGWDLLKIAKSEIGSNRANRKNRFFTVVQYCLDIASVLRELQRVCKYDARIIFVVGHQSNVLGVPFYNAEIISALSTQSNLFELKITQKRIFKNKFGKVIREDLLNFCNKNSSLSVEEMDKIARNVARKVLYDGLEIVSEKNKPDLLEAIAKISDLSKSPIYNSETTTYYEKPINTFTST